MLIIEFSALTLAHVRVVVEFISTQMYCLTKDPVLVVKTPPFLPHRHSSDRVNQLEALVETYKRKLEDLGDLRRQVRLLEERNTVYMQRTCELEEELRRANAVRSQLDTYKRQARWGLKAPELTSVKCSFYRELLPAQTVSVLSDSQAHELHTKHSAEAMKAEKWQFEYKNLHDKYDALLKDKEVSW